MLAMSIIALISTAGIAFYARVLVAPETERRAIEDQDDLFQFLKQSHISEKNVISSGTIRATCIVISPY
jgi:hypothetical protein